jgi:acyl-CoA thioesterase-1
MMLGIEQSEKGCFVLRSARPGTVVTSTDNTEAELRIYDWTATARFERTTEARQRWEKLSSDRWRLMKRVGGAYDYVGDDPRLPNVLLIGDSISIYYTDTVRRLLAGHADVCRTPMAPGKAETLFASLDEFLERGKWDVIHFNSGLHDFARAEGNEEDLRKYRENLKIIIDKLRRTGARLIWASTTPVPEKAPAQVTSDALCRKYNATALALMNEEGIAVNDLYTAVLPDHFRYWTAPNNIHFNEAGSAFLGRRVANAILGVLSGEESP